MRDDLAGELIVAGPIHSDETVKQLAAEFYRLQGVADLPSTDRMLLICDAMRAWMQPLRGRALSMQQYHLVQTATAIINEAPALRRRCRLLAMQSD